MNPLICRLKILYHGLKIQKLPNGQVVVFQPRSFRYVGAQGPTVEAGNAEPGGQIRVNILGKTFSLSQVPLKTLDKRGFVDAQAQTIQIAADIHPQAKEETILHEAIHVLDMALDLELNEGQVKRLGHSLYQVLMANGVSLAPLLEGILDKPPDTP